MSNTFKLSDIQVAIADHRAHSGPLTDWRYVAQLREADRIVSIYPALLAALEELCAEAEQFHNERTEGFNMARAAIAAARGGQS